MATYEKLLYRRSNFKGRMTRIYNFVNNNDNEYKIHELQVRKSELAELYKKYNEVQDDIEIIDGDKPERHVVYEQERSATEEKYYQQQARISELIMAYEEDRNEAKSSTQSAPAHIKPSNLNIPRLEIPYFDGNLNEWTNFKGLFDGVIDANEQLTDLQKLQYLKSLLRGEASGLIKALIVTNENYPRAITLLTKRYENKLINVNFHIRNIMSVQNINKTNIKDFLVTLQQSIDSLKSLNVPVDTWDLILIYIFVQKLDQPLRAAWELNKSTDNLPKFNEFVEFLSHRSLAFELMNDNKPASRTTNMLKPAIRVSTHIGTVNNICIMCNMSHELHKCLSFLGMTTAQRFDFVKNKKLCFNCLRPYSSQHKCSKNNCFICHKRHHTTIHTDSYSKLSANPGTNTASASSGKIYENNNNVSSSVLVSSTENQAVIPHTLSNDNTQASVLLLHTNRSEVYLSTALIQIKNSEGEWVSCHALLDSGSQVSLITKHLASKLNLTLSQQTKYIIHGVGDNPTHSSTSTTVNIASRYNNYTTVLTCIVTDLISNKLPQTHISLDNFKLPKDYKLADPLFNVPKTVDLLLGGKIFYSLLLQGHIQLGPQLPTLINTVFGWVVTGDIELSMQSLFNTINYQSYTNNSHTQTILSAHVSCEQSCNQLLQRFWEQEEVNPIQTLTPEHTYCEDLYNKTTHRDNTGRFTVQLPFISNQLHMLGSSYNIAFKCFLMLEKRFQRDPSLHKQYSDFIEEYISLGHASYLPISMATHRQENTMFFLPHHAVIKPNSISTKIRVVFNGSSLSSSGLSLNDVLYEGPNIYTDIIDIIIRLRTFKFVLSCDIIKMFRNINVTEEHCNFQCILWRRLFDSDLQIIRLNTVTYGTRCAPT